MCNKLYISLTLSGDLVAFAGTMEQLECAN